MVIIIIITILTFFFFFKLEIYHVDFSLCEHKIIWNCSALQPIFAVLCLNNCLSICCFVKGIVRKICGWFFSRSNKTRSYFNSVCVSDCIETKARPIFGGIFLSARKKPTPQRQHYKQRKKQKQKKIKQTPERREMILSTQKRQTFFINLRTKGINIARSVDIGRITDTEQQRPESSAITPPGIQVIQGR